MAEETENVEKDINQKENNKRLSKILGRLSNKAFFKARQALRNGEDFDLLSEAKQQREGKSKIIYGQEVKDWGLNAEFTVYDKELEAYEREIL